ncbi:transketolase [Bifidobacterium sp. ESL0732]|uniref:transketolase n=1 Tax=Bifidobacterium sp. ESL0732 TaxID=2983222 RepID=UPI0023F8D5FD|nr:transketolase [Bifidobacterium sp. ESL0732]WEV64314.1 transketolase [Bifidobacterium sp. ESL0732]
MNTHNTTNKKSTTQSPSEPVDIETLKALSRKGRWLVMSTVAASKAGHIGGPLSAMDMFVALYFRQLNIDPEHPDDPHRDRFILSKGHNAIGLYSVLAMRGYFPIEELKTFDHGDSRLQGHPDMLKTPGIDISSGSLGQGLSVGIGMALGAKKLGKSFHTWVMLGDGECQEGMVWEAILSAPRFKLDNLTAIIDLNGLELYGWEAGPNDRFDRGEPLGHVDLPSVFHGFGWNVIEIDGNDFTSILGGFDKAMANRGSGKPSIILAKTTKGAGVSFTSGTYKWHNGVATPEQLAIARDELKQGEEDKSAISTREGEQS